MINALIQGTAVYGKPGDDQIGLKCVLQFEFNCLIPKRCWPIIKPLSNSLLLAFFFPFPANCSRCATSYLGRFAPGLAITINCAHSHPCQHGPSLGLALQVVTMMMMTMINPGWVTWIEASLFSFLSIFHPFKWTRKSSSTKQAWRKISRRDR